MKGMTKNNNNEVVRFIQVEEMIQKMSYLSENALSKKKKDQYFSQRNISDLIKSRNIFLKFLLKTI